MIKKLSTIAVETVKKGLASLGDRYIEDLSQGIATNWIDVFENQEKVRAYPAEVTIMFYILMNYDNKISDLYHTVENWGIPCILLFKQETAF